MGCDLIVRGYQPSSYSVCLNSEKRSIENDSTPFSGLKKYKVIQKNALKNSVPIISFISSIMGSTGYFLGGVGLLYDLKKDKQNNIKNEEKKPGVKTVTAHSDLAQLGMNCAKIGIAASSVANIACGVGEGLPLMALGEVPNLFAANIIETPIGTGLFGIGIASIFAGLALDNTPNLKLNSLDLMAEKGVGNKTKLVLNNMWNAAKETGSSMFDLIKNITHPDFYKENFLELTPRTVVFSESIKKDGTVVLEKVLRNRKNYIMHAASFILTLGGLGIILNSILNWKKPQEASLKVEEGGFLFDNFGITKYGVDRLSTGSKTAGSSFIVGGIVNAVSQFVGLDNKDGRALQWLGIAGVFLGYSIDRGKHLKGALKCAKERPELTRVVREWQVNLSDMVNNKAELKKLQAEIKAQGVALAARKTGSDIPAITNVKFVKMEKALNKAIDTSTVRPKEEIEKVLNKLNVKFEYQSVIAPEKAQKVLEICSEKMFGKNPTEVV